MFVATLESNQVWHTPRSCPDRTRKSILIFMNMGAFPFEAHFSPTFPLPSSLTNKQQHEDLLGGGRLPPTHHILVNYHIVHIVSRISNTSDFYILRTYWEAIRDAVARIDTHETIISEKIPRF